ncbi:transposase family protein [Streptomyces wedmorensis]
MDADAKHRPVFVERLLATLVHLRHRATHDVPACRFGMNRSTITRPIGKMPPQLAERGCAVSPDVRPRTLAEVIDHLGAGGKTGLIDGTEIPVRRPAAGRKDRDRFISGKNQQNTVTSMVATDSEGHAPRCSPTTSESHADITHARQSGLVRLLADGPPSRSLPMPATRASTLRPAEAWPHHHTASPRRTPPTGTKRCTSDSARHTPHAASGSSTASHT